MTKRNDSANAPSRLMVVGAWISGIASIGAMVAMILIAIDKIQTGHGLDTFRSHWLVEDNWVGFFVSVVLIMVIAVLAAAIAWFQRRQERREIQQLQAKYSGRDHG